MQTKLISALSLFLALLTLLSFSSVAFAADEDDTITVTFSLVGDTAHGSEGTHYGSYNWIESKKITVRNNTTVFQLFKDVIDNEGFTYEASNGYVISVTSPGGCQIGEFVNSENSGLMYTVNGEIAMVGASQYILSDGDNVTWAYIDNYKQKVSFEPEIDINNMSSYWNTYHANGGVISNDKDIYETTKNFEIALKNSNDWSTSLSDALVINDNVYIVAGNKLCVLNENGETVNTTTLISKIGYTSRPVYANGLIVIPLSNGTLQAVTADTLKTIWVSGTPVVTNAEGKPQGQQALTTLTYNNGYIYYGTACAGSASTTSGMFACVELLTGKQVWQYTNTSSGYYWSGADIIGNSVVFAGDDGILISLNKKTGEVINTLDTQLGGVRSTVVINNNKVYFSTRTGNLGVAEISNNGIFGDIKSTHFANSSTCTPTIANDKIIVGGCTSDWKGALAIINLDTLEIEHEVSAIADIKSAPVVNNTPSGTYVYFTANKTPGSLYSYKLGSNDTEAQEVFTPEGTARNYCLASPVADSKGNIYYTNDSGKIFSISPKNKDIVMGDVNGDGIISIVDCVYIQKYTLELIEFNNYQMKVADLSGDKNISVADVVLLQREILQNS